MTEQTNAEVHRRVNQSYKEGFVTDIESDTLPPGLNEDVIRAISAKKNEPQWLLNWRLKAYQKWLSMEQPNWAKLNIPEIDFNAISYFSSPKKDENAPKSLEEVDPKLLETYAKLGVPLHEQEVLAGVKKPKVAVDVVFDSVSVNNKYKKELKNAGVIFCSFSEAVHDYPELVKQYLGKAVAVGDN